MAIGDAVAAFMGAAATNRQPASGVEEQISNLNKGGTTDAVQLYNGSTGNNILEGGQNTAGSLTATSRNMAVMITNSVYFRKNGSTDVISIGGVQTNA